MSFFSLGRALTRNEAVTMLVRLLGQEDEALSGNYAMPFTDVADWAKPYVAYAYSTGRGDDIRKVAITLENQGNIKK